jgi:VanZ family protein
MTRFRFTWKQWGAALVESSTPWTWISAIYGLQVMGALWVTHVLALDFRQLALPICLLALGAVSSFILGRFNHRIGSSMWKLWVPAAIYALFITSLSHRSFSGTQVPFSTNLFHPVEYMTFAILFSWAWYPLMMKKGRKIFVLAVLSTGTLFAIADEIHQSFVPGRYPSLVDLVLDVAGLCVGIGLFLVAGYVHGVLKPHRNSSN